MIARIQTALVLMFLIFSVHLVLSVPSQAMERDFRTLLKAGGYGVLGGVAMGLVTLPVTQDPYALLVGGAIGFSLGIVVGIYHMDHRNDPQNPFFTEPAESNQDLAPEHQGTALPFLLPAEASNSWSSYYRNPPHTQIVKLDIWHF